MWCGGTRETREPRATVGKFVSKRETTKNLLAFQDLSGRIFLWVSSNVCGKISALN